MKKCPNCGKITDRKFCSSCGTSLVDVPEIEEQIAQDIVADVQEDKAVIEEPVAEGNEIAESGSELNMEESAGQAPSSAEDLAGNEVQKDENKTEKTEVAASAGGEKKSKQSASGKKKILIAAIAAVAVIVIAIAGITASNAAKEKAAKEAYDNAVLTMRANTGMMNLDVSTLNIYEDKIDCMEELINLTNKVWRDSIYEEVNDDTYKYIKGTSDFNEAVNNLYYSDEVIEFNNTLSDHLDLIKNDKTEIPDSLSDAKAAYVKVLTAYQALVSWCEWPNGSYSTYMEQSQAKYDEFFNAYNEFDILCPEWENPNEGETKTES